ncbi:MAG: hypothetical protein RR182_07175 [Alistipes sp.]
MRLYLLSFVLLFAACNSSDETVKLPVDADFSRVYEYTPAPGQFINDELLSGFRGENTPDAACAYADKRLRNNTNPMSFVSLGGWGGSLVVGFDKGIANDGGYNLLIEGNEFNNSSEPGIVWVAADDNGDGRPNDTWYELRGSESGKSISGYAVTYTRPADKASVQWVDNRGASGTIERTDEHKQAQYYPTWISANSYTLTGTRLPDNVEYKNQQWVTLPFQWGYADNYSTEGRDLFRISDAVDASGKAVQLARIHFVKIQTGCHVKAPLIGESSTEVCAIRNYNLLK